MGTKNNPGEFDCWEMLEGDEPYFILAGRDPSASQLVLLWANERELAIQRGDKPVQQMAKVREAQKVAAAMRQFYEERQKKKMQQLNDGLQKGQ